jgi:hypothetical protein
LAQVSAELTPIRISDLYDDPENFIPDRYLLTENGTKPGVDGSDLRPTFTFGAGRVSIKLDFSKPTIHNYTENLPRSARGSTHNSMFFY